MRGRLFKRLSVVFVCMALFCASAISVFAGYDVMPRYNNVAYADATVLVSDSGMVQTSVAYECFSTITKVDITICIEKKTLFFFWTDVDEWCSTIYSGSYIGGDTYQLSKEGTYRVTITFDVYGADGTVDTITKEVEVEW